MTPPPCPRCAATAASRARRPGRPGLRRLQPQVQLGRAAPKQKGSDAHGRATSAARSRGQLKRRADPAVYAPDDSAGGSPGEWSGAAGVRGGLCSEATASPRLPDLDPTSHAGSALLSPIRLQQAASRRSNSSGLVSMKGARLSSTFRIHCVVSPVLVGGVGVLREVSPPPMDGRRRGAGW